jgi:Fe2+ transport system protein B
MSVATEAATETVAAAEAAAAVASEAATAAAIWHFALVGTPNSGKTALFNALTGSP